MLTRLHIRNYAIISELDIQLHPGLTIVTGETGAGKSILLGALSLVLGKRADSSVLYQQEEKCVVEADFDVVDFSLQDFFEAYDIDQEPVSTLRREISAQGRSRAFINDTPVLLPVLHELAERLIDVHSQHEVHTLKEADFRAGFLDSCADGGKTYGEFLSAFRKWDGMRKQVERLEEEAKRSRAEEDYLRFQLQELDELRLNSGELEEAELRLDVLENAEEIRSTLAAVNAQLNDGEQPILDGLRLVLSEVLRLSKKYSNAGVWAQRLDSAVIELTDIANEMERGFQNIDDDPEEAARLRERVDAIHRLLNKHRKQTDAELLDFQQELVEKLDRIESSDSELDVLKKELLSLERTMSERVEKLTMHRSKVAAELGERLSSQLHELGMPDATVRFSLERKDKVNVLGQDIIHALFSANKGQRLQDISKVASGGELSRLMLVIKAEMARNSKLPTVIFDEIDTGVSGEVADRMGSKIRQLSSYMQVLCITHLPQIAAKGAQHLFVFKEEQGGRTVTRVRPLSGSERVVEIAKMLSSDSPTDAAIAHAEQLVQQV